jgi:signal transduction histidine kinase/ActR/RegA family two-component response regulator
MIDSGASRRDRRLLVLPPTVRDGTTTKELLVRAGLSATICDDIPALLDEIERGAGAVLLTEEATAAAGDRFAATLRRQPSWSDLPILVLARPGADSDESELAVRLLGNVTLLERPVRVASLLSAVRSALRARDRQYQIRDHLADRERVETSLRDADRRKDEFLATLGHELRNPLAPLSTSLALLQLAGSSSPEVDGAVAVIGRQVTHLRRLVDDLLEVSRITRGLIEVKREHVDLVDVLQVSIENSRALISNSRHTLAVELPVEPLPLRGDAVRLTQVFSNLIHNAAKYTEENGRIQLRARREDECAVVEVRDNGIGLAPRDLSSIFEMFTQVDRSSRRTQGGLGIGLTLARSLVEKHGGTIRATSPGVGKGSTFEVRLPLASFAASGVSDRADLPSFEGLSLVVADDNRDGAEALGSLLRSLGARVEVVHGGAEALVACERLRPDAAILDIGMPHMDGYEVARRIRAFPWSAETTLIALSGWGQEGDVRRSAVAGFDHHLVKPADIEELWRRVTTGSRTRPAARAAS